MQNAFQSVTFKLLQDRHHITCHTPTTWNDSAPHADPFSRLYYIDAGRGHVTYNGKRISLTQGHLYLFPANRPIHHHAAPGLDHYYVHFLAHLPGALSLFDLTEWRTRRSCSDREATKRQMNRLIASPQTPAALLEQQATLQWLVAGFMKSFREDLQARMDQIRRFGPVVEYIHQHLDAPIAIPTLARLASLHPNYFSNLFTASFGESPREYILNKRIERAQLLLWQTERPLKQIADAVGYDNVPYFCRLFKQRTGLTPGTYRSQR